MSYFRDVYLESSSSPHNRELHVILSSGRYQLCTSNAVYSFEDKYVNFKRTFEWIDWNNHPVKKVLLLGLGLGSVPQMLEEVYRQNMVYHAVEIDEVIIGLANKYILKDLDSQISIFHTDALHYVKVSDEKYDMIVMDVFDSDKVPEKFENPEFLDDLEGLLNDDGFILFNRLNITEKDHEDSKRYFEEIFLHKFPQACSVPVEGNFMLNSRKDIFALLNS